MGEREGGWRAEMGKGGSQTVVRTLSLAHSCARFSVPPLACQALPDQALLCVCPCVRVRARVRVVCVPPSVCVCAAAGLLQCGGHRDVLSAGCGGLCAGDARRRIPHIHEGVSVCLSVCLPACLPSFLPSFLPPSVSLSTGNVRRIRQICTARARKGLET
eukprot:COSAG03_NODE_2571_length_2633_cov_2.310182_1_plen_159_part_10